MHEAWPVSVLPDEDVEDGSGRTPFRSRRGSLFDLRVENESSDALRLEIRGLMGSCSSSASSSPMLTSRSKSKSERLLVRVKCKLVAGSGGFRRVLSV